MIGALIHGREVLFTVTEPDLPKDASTHTEILGHALTLVAREEPLHNLALTIQADNTPRETKNNVVLAFLTSLVCRGAFATRKNKNVHNMYEFFCTLEEGGPAIRLCRLDWCMAQLRSCARSHTVVAAQRALARRH